MAAVARIFLVYPYTSIITTMTAMIASEPRPHRAIFIFFHGEIAELARFRRMVVRWVHVLEKWHYGNTFHSGRVLLLGARPGILSRPLRIKPELRVI
jgi:hypothetical protein